MTKTTRRAEQLARRQCVPRPRGVCGYRPRRRPATEQPTELDEFLRDSPGTAAALREVEQLSDGDLARLEETTSGVSEELRREILDPDPQEAAEIVRLHEKGAGMIGESPEITAADHERYETSRYRDYATIRVLWIAARIEAGRRRERRDPLYLGPNRWGQVSRRFSRRWGHLRPSQVNRHPGARRDIARELYGHHGRAPRPATNTRTRGSRRGATTRSSSRGGDPGDGDPEPPPRPATPARAGALTPVRGRP